MPASTPSSLDSTALSRRLGELAGDERELQVEFLLHLAEFDRRRAWAEAGYGSLWEYLLRVLHLREGAAGRRIAAMRVLRRLPVLADALRDGRLCLSTVALLGPVLTEDNVAEVVARAAYLTKAEVERLVASLAPRSAPKEGLRRTPDRRDLPSAALAPPLAPPAPGREVTCAPSTGAPTPAAEAPAPARAPESRPTVRPVDADTYSLRVTVDAAFKAELDALKALLAHKVPSGDLAAVLREAVHCALEKHGKRKGTVVPKRKRKASAEAQRPASAGQQACAPVPAEVRREVWRRDEGRCTWRGPDGHRCGSRWKLELDHIRPAALGGPSTVENLRVVCATHNQLHADQVFGREYMDAARRGRPRVGEVASPRDSAGTPA
jgi:hypothetical protein